MPTYMTLAYGGTEKALADWGISQDSVTASFKSLDQDTFSCQVADGYIDDEPVIPFEGAVIIRKGRTSATGEPDTFAGGSIEFQGKRVLSPLDGQPDRETINYTFAGPWYDLEQTPYLQPWRQWNGDDPATFTDVYTSDITLFTKYNAGATYKWERIQTAEQITIILNALLAQYTAQGLAAPYQVGTIEPDVAVPTYQVVEVMSAEAIRMCLRSAPDATAWFDYTTSPPTFHIKYRSSLTAVSRDIAAADTKSISLIPRYDLQPRAVVILFRTTNEVDGVPWVEYTTQKYGPNGSNSASDPSNGLRVLVQTVALEGYRTSTVSGKIHCRTIDSDGQAWWAYRVSELQGDAGTVTGWGVIGTPTVKDDEGNTVSLVTYPRELVAGTGIAPWMGYSAIKVTIKANAYYDLSSADGANFPSRGYEFKELSWTGIITDAPANASEDEADGTYWTNLQTTASYEAGETVPAGLAQRIYTGLATLQYDGQLVLVDTDCPSDVSMGNVVNITGSKPEWLTMNAQVVSVDKDYGSGTTRIAIGAAQYLTAAEFTSLFNFNRFRRVWYDPTAIYQGTIY